MNQIDSYTNKDFNSIYIELLEYAKRLSDRWDPTASNESDPGVVLLKLAAIIGDKDSYNIDKNVLELMPASVSQIAAARQLFDQCGYTMRYFRSAEGFLNITIKKHPEEKNIEDSINYTYTVPMFTMFTDSTSSVIYSTTEDVSMPLNMETPVPVIEGTIVEYSVNNDPLITTSNLDSNNRLYFTDTNIAENGIFITNHNANNFKQWYRTDNLQIEPKGKLCYKFGVANDESVCYIEFPDDIDLLMGEGLNITYVKTSGLNGNVSDNKIKNFQADTQFIRKTPELALDDEYVKVTTDEVSIRNVLPIVGGQNPETIDAAYKSYKRVKDTFDTLVSLKDYTDYMITSESASNGFVTDRTNDIAHSYKIHDASKSSDSLLTVVESSEGQPSMSPFDLCIYALQFVPNVTDVTTYRNTFILTDGSTYEKTLSEESIKSIQHNFKELEENRILMIKNKYAINATIVPKSKLSETEQNEIKLNVERALYKSLNSKEIEFGAAVSVDSIYDVIIRADDRIKTIVDFTSPTYETYAVYKPNNYSIAELRIDVNGFDGGYTNVILNKGLFEKYIKEKIDLFYYDESSNTIKQVLESSLFDKSLTYYIYNTKRHDLWNSFRAEIFAKNILSGVTPLYDKDESYNYGINQKTVKEYTDITYVTTETKIDFTERKESPGVWDSPVLTENESILLTAPALIKENEYSSYVKIIYSIAGEGSISSNSRYTLQGEDYIIFFWKASNDASDYTYIKYAAKSGSRASIITPVGFALKQGNNIEDTASEYFKTLPVGVQGKTNSSANHLELGNKTETDYIASLTKDTNNKTSAGLATVLSGLHKIETYNENTIHLNNNKNGSNNFYWILNRTNEFGNYVLFQEDESEYTLKSGEYFIYTNAEKTAMFLLGEGTVLTRQGDTAAWVLPSITYQVLIRDGLDAIPMWKTLDQVTESSIEDATDGYVYLWATQMQQYLIGPGNIVTLRALGTTENVKEITFENILTDLSEYSVSYTTANSSSSATVVDVTDASWKARSILNLNASPDKPQKLTKNQTLKVYSEEQEQYTPDITDAYIVPDRELSFVGGELINVTLLGSVAAYKPLNILMYTTNLDDESNKLYYDNTSCTATIQLSEEETTVELPEFQLDSGLYILQLIGDTHVTSQKLDVRSNSEDYTLSYLLNPSDTVNSLYSIRVSSKNPARIQLNYTATIDYSEGVSVTIPSIYKYKTTTLDSIKSSDFDSSPSFEELLLSELSKLDPKGIYRYTQGTIVSKPIKNPLMSQEFLNSDHFYNKYTICEWDTEVYKLHIATAVK